MGLSFRKGKTTAIVPAGGHGRRIGAAVPKQFLEIQGIPILIRTLHKLGQCPDVDGILVSVPSDSIEESEKLIKRWKIRKIIRTVPGGAERQDSVRNSLQCLPEGTELVLVHDAVRPFISILKISESIKAARESGGAILAIPSKDTIKSVHNHRVDQTLDRSLLWQVQTPQVFRTEWILKAYEKTKKGKRISTDDSVLVEKLGYPVKVILGEERNIKITSRVDLIFAEALAAEEEK